MDIIDEIKASFKKGSNLTKLIYINLAVYVIIQFIKVIFFLFNSESDFISSVVTQLAVPADFSALLKKPWTMVSYMFLHIGFLHILFNILWLYWFGRIFLEYLDGKKLLSIYLLGGFSGAILYIIAYNAFPVFEDALPVSVALGASASVLAIVIAISVYVPNYTVYLLFIGPVKLKYIALFTIVLDFISIAGTNPGGHIAHLGGALFGWFYIQQFRKGRDIARGFNRFMDYIFSFFKPTKKMQVTYKRHASDYDYNKSRVEKQAVIDRILEKISKSGYDSLTKEEKEILFRQSNHN
jgi:membrane associated rhomboid family serine protease